MEVICISNDWPIAMQCGHFMPKEGQTVNVTKKVYHPRWGLYYILEEGSPNFGYDADKFALPITTPCLKSIDYAF